MPVRLVLLCINLQLGWLVSDVMFSCRGATNARHVALTQVLQHMNDPSVLRKAATMRQQMTGCDWSLCGSQCMCATRLYLGKNSVCVKTVSILHSPVGQQANTTPDICAGYHVQGT